ncbi:hypothetical protein [Paracoccus pantotrophus]|uniref:hypothetical protein n=1 Tax=Paracoccus pantotrophus TaxID=82367 RepID=UPI0015A60379|nr:hypothetical protein [Paracoccus pantotrophus]
MGSGHAAADVADAGYPGQAGLRRDARRRAARPMQRPAVLPVAVAVQCARRARQVFRRRAGRKTDDVKMFHPVPPKRMMPQIVAKSSFFVSGYQPKCKRFF